MGYGMLQESSTPSRLSPHPREDSHLLSSGVNFNSDLSQPIFRCSRLVFWFSSDTVHRFVFSPLAGISLYFSDQRTFNIVLKEFHVDCATSGKTAESQTDVLSHQPEVCWAKPAFLHLPMWSSHTKRSCTHRESSDRLNQHNIPILGGFCTVSKQLMERRALVTNLFLRFHCRCSQGPLKTPPCSVDAGTASGMPVC